MPFATGYVEGNYVQIAPVATAQILALTVTSGDRVTSGQPLVELEKRDAEIALAQAEAAMSRADSQLANLRQGKRPEEIRVIEASLASARAQAAEARPLPPALAAMHSELAKDFPPVIEDRALEGELRLCLQRIAEQHWRLHA